jgi:hypothetical protein
MAVRRPAPEPLGSVIVNTPVEHACATCGSDRTTILGMTLTDGSEVTFVSCRACEAKRWVGPDGDLTSDEVLQRTRKP